MQSGVSTVRGKNKQARNCLSCDNGVTGKYLRRGKECVCAGRQRASIKKKWQTDAAIEVPEC